MSAISILGIPLTKPSRGGVTAFAVVATFGILAAIGLSLIGLFNPESAILFAGAIAGGSFASAVGVQVLEHGWRGLVVTALFGLLVVGVTGVVMKLFF